MVHQNSCSPCVGINRSDGQVWTVFLCLARDTMPLPDSLLAASFLLDLREIGFQSCDHDFCLGCSGAELIRFEALIKLKEAGIPTVVWLCPVLPFINDTEENLRGILDYCIRAEVKGIICFGMGLTLREGNREYFYKKLDEHFPGMKERYISTFGDSYQCNSPHNRRLMKIFYDVCHKNGIMYNPDEIFEYLHTFVDKNEENQMTLF